MTESLFEASQAEVSQPETARPVSPLLSLHGAFAASGLDTGVAVHYGNPMLEQRALSFDRSAQDQEPLVLVDRSCLGVVRVEGPDRQTWMTSIASQILTGMTAGESREFLLLSPQGRVEYAPAAIEDGEALWLIVEGNQAQLLTDYLNRMKFMMRVEVQNLSDEYAVLESARNPILQDGSVHPALAEGKPLVWEDPWHTPAPGSYRYDEAGDHHPGADYVRFLSIVPRAVLPALAESSDARFAGLWAAEALRIEAWRPRYGTEADDKTIPQELDYTRTAVHFDKGCYKGQETVARVHNLGRPPRRLVFLDIDGSEHTLPAVGSELFVEGKSRPVGRITSVALHYEAGPIALAVIKRGIDPQAPLRAVDGSDFLPDGSPAPATEYAVAQTTVVSPESGEVARRSLAGQDFLKR